MRKNITRISAGIFLLLTALAASACHQFFHICEVFPTFPGCGE